MRRSLSPAVLLLLATLAVYSPYAGARFVSGNADRDAVAYLTVLIDACQQARAGVFPVYVGQSEARFNGGLYPQAQAPLFTLLAPALDLVTARSLGPVALLNLMLVLAALSGAAAMFACLCRLDPCQPWMAAALAFAYAVCPGVLGVLVRLDMVTTFLALPLLPCVWRALMLAWEGDERRAGVALGLSLAALVALHPPVALWTAVAALAAGIAGLALTRRGWRAALVAGAVFALAAAWPLATALELTGGRAHTVGLSTASGGARLDADMAAAIVKHVRADFPAALFPVGWSPGSRVNGWPVDGHEAAFLPEAWRRGAVLPYLQLGWALWIALAFGVAVVSLARWRRQAVDARLAALLVGAAVVALFLFPVPGVTAWAWSALPALFSVTKWWPMQRLYIVLASLAAPAGLLAWSAWERGADARRRRLFAALAVLLTAWSAREAAKFGAWAFTRREPASVARLENLPLRAKDLQMSAPRRLPGYADAAWFLRLVEADGSVRADNLETVRGACRDARPLRSEPDDAFSARLRLEPGRRALLCLREAPPGLRLEAFGQGLYRSLMTGVWRDASGLELLPLFSEDDTARDVSVRLLGPDGTPADLGGRLALAAYEREALPLRVLSWVPLQVDVPAAPPGVRLALETRRQFVPGYRARVDGREVPVEPSGAGLVQVPLEATPARVTLEFVGPWSVRAAAWISLAAWIAAATAAIQAWRRRRSAPPRAVEA
jgi:hypothetical protein